MPTVTLRFSPMAEHVRTAITGVHLGLTQDIASVSEMVAASVNDAVRPPIPAPAMKMVRCAAATERPAPTLELRSRSKYGDECQMEPGAADLKSLQCLPDVLSRDFKSKAVAGL